VDTGSSGSPNGCLGNLGRGAESPGAIMIGCVAPGRAEEGSSDEQKVHAMYVYRCMKRVGGWLGARARAFMRKHWM